MSKLNEVIECTAKGNIIMACTDLKIKKDVEVWNYYIEHRKFKNGVKYRITIEELGPDSNE